MSETWRGTWVVAYREVLKFLTERSRLIGTFIQPLLLLVVFGAGFSELIGPLAPGVGFVDFIFPGLIAMTALTTSLFAGISVVSDRENGFLREILVAPMSRTGIVLGKACGAAVVAVMQAWALLLIAPLAGVEISLAIALGIVPVIAVLAVALSAVGLLLATVLRSQQGFQLVIQVLIFPLIFLAGVFFPLNSVPDWLEVASLLNPLTYGVDAIRQVFLDGATDSGLGVELFGHVMSLGQELLIIGGLGAVLIAAAGWAFSRQQA